MNATLFLDAALDALLDSLRMLPFLFVAFLILEALEHYSSNRLTHFFQHKKGGPAIASLLGCIPQCGFSTLISSLYCGGIVTVGTLIAVYLSTSDEAILILLAHSDRAGVVGKLLLAKLIIAIPAGYLVDFIWNRWRHPQKHVEDLCDHCGCHDHHGIIRPALNHTLKLFAFILVFNAVLNLLLEGIQKSLPDHMHGRDPVFVLCPSDLVAIRHICHTAPSLRFRIRDASVLRRSREFPCRSTARCPPLPPQRRLHSGVHVCHSRIASR